MRRSILLTTSLAAMLLTAVPALAVPPTVSFTGRIQDAGGPVDGTVDLGFRIYDAETGGTLLWEETHTGVVADNGLVYVELGSIDPTGNGLDSSVFTGADVWLELSVDGNTQSPRQSIGSVPYAVRAATSDTLGSLAPGDVALSTHNHDADYAALSHSHTHDHDADYAALSHTHVHNHDGDYAALSHTHVHNHDGRYAAAAHTHSAADITSGTLSNARFSAYSDLTAEGRLDNNSGTDLLTRTQADARYFRGLSYTRPTAGPVSGGASDTTIRDSSTWDYCALAYVNTRSGSCNLTLSSVTGWTLTANSALGSGTFAECAMMCMNLF